MNKLPEFESQEELEKYITILRGEIAKLKPVEHKTPIFKDIASCKEFKYQENLKLSSSDLTNYSFNGEAVEDPQASFEEMVERGAKLAFVKQGMLLKNARDLQKELHSLKNPEQDKGK